MACHGEITPVGHANGNAGCPATQPYMNTQVASTDPGRRTLILSHCVVGQTAGEHEHVAERLPCRTKAAATEPRRRGPFLSNYAGGQTAGDGEQAAA